MEKIKSLNFLESKIKERAETRIGKELEEAAKFIKNHPILHRLRIVVENKVVSLMGESHDFLFRAYGVPPITPKFEKITNFTQIREELLKKYMKQEGDQLIDQLDLLKNYLQ